MVFKQIGNWIRDFLKKSLDRTDDRESTADIIEEIKSGIEFRGSSVWILICAVFIASLGLNVNSTAVIIGAMLISPLMGPIMGVGLGLGVYDFELIKKSFRNLGVATLFSVATSTLYFLISPLNEARSELLARTAPTIYDVLIAFFGGLAGIVAVSSKLKGNVIPGVAIATALMPPLCTAGYGLACGNMYYFLGAFYLYFINSVFISFATTLGVKLMHFRKKTFVDKKREKTVQRIVYSILFLTIAPSVFITYRMIRDNLFETSAAHFIRAQLDFPDTQILNRNISMKGGQRTIEVSLIGKEVPEDSITMVESLLPKYGLQDTRLIVSQGYNASQHIDLNTLNTSVFQEIYKDNQVKLEHQAFTIDSLRARVEKYQHYDSIGLIIAPEIKVLFPTVTGVAISNQIFSNLDSMRLDTMTLAVITLNRPLKQVEEERFEEWLKARLDVKRLKLLVEKN